MRVESIRQWQWMILSLALGCGIGYVREQARDDLANQYGSEINGKARFEQALLNLEQGRPCFTDISVHGRTVPDGRGGTKPAHLVSGLYFNGHYEPRDGKLAARWEPAFYLADVPYKPAGKLEAVADAKSAARFASLARPTVTDYLDTLAATHGVRYTRSWWRGMGMWEWTLASFIVVGVVWPVTVNLMVFGSLRRPREEKGVDLSKVKLPAPVAEPRISEADLDQVAELAAAIEGELADGQQPGVAADVPAPVAAPVRQLEVAEVRAAEVSDGPRAEFGAKPEDFYPTAKKAKATGKS